jgi:undecaprenyl-diphosphatase
MVDIIDTSLAISLNKMAGHLTGVLPFFSDWMVYLVLALSAAWVIAHHLGRPKAIALDFIYTLAAPVGFAVIISEVLSKLINRSRPFVVSKEITLLIPHDADGGFPSHHTTVMIAIAVALWFRNHNFGNLLLILSILSGLARIGAGIHYPTDIAAGVLIGWLTAWSIHRLTKEQRLRALRF